MESRTHSKINGCEYDSGNSMAGYVGDMQVI